LLVLLGRLVCCSGFISVCCSDLERLAQVDWVGQNTCRAGLAAQAINKLNPSTNHPPFPRSPSGAQSQAARGSFGIAQGGRGGGVERGLRGCLVGWWVRWWTCSMESEGARGRRWEQERETASWLFGSFDCSLLGRMVCGCLVGSVNNLEEARD
jgi:hypothetical protein